MFADFFERDNLDWKSREPAAVGALAATPGVEPQLRSHMAASLRVGLTADQLRHLTEVLAEGYRKAPRSGSCGRRRASAPPSSRTSSV